MPLQCYKLYTVKYKLYKVFFKGMGFGEDLGSLAIKFHATNQVKIASERV